MSDPCCGPDPKSAPQTESDTAPRPPWYRDVALGPSALSGIFLILGFVLTQVGSQLPGQIAYWAALVVGAWTFVPGAMRRLRQGRLGVGLLMTIAATGAVILGHVPEAAALAFLFSMAEALEDRAMDRAREGLHALLSIIPQTARVKRNDGTVEVAVQDIAVQDILVVGAGARMVTDGVVTQGRSSVDTSVVTGESIPVEVGPGDPVPAGAINGSGSLLIAATADGRDNSLTQIVALVSQAHANKGQRARLADRIARPLVPMVLIAAALVAGYGFLVGEPGLWIERALVVLVAASPCAMAIAVPVTVISAIGSASKFGVVIKSGQAFEQFGTIETVVFDKTGTLTLGSPQVARVHPVGDWDIQQVLGFAAAVESTSSHPLAGAIMAAAPVTTPALELHEQPGHGITGQVGGQTVRVGSPRWIALGEHATQAEAMAEEGMTLVVVEVDQEVAGIIGVRDELRPEARETVTALRSQGIDVVMLTGDNVRTAHALAAEAGIDKVYAEQLPADKAAVITSLVAQGPTAMVGDGINDAPALASATVGIAMGASGAAAAVESADIALTGHDLRAIPGALAHARRGRRIMTMNIGLALAIIVVLFPLALFGVLGLAAVVLVHEVAEVIVILNGIRAARKPLRSTQY